MISRLLIVGGVVGVFTVFGTLTHLAYPEFSQKQIDRVADMGDTVSLTINEKQNAIAEYSSNALSVAGEKMTALKNVPSDMVTSVSYSFSALSHSVGETFDDTKTQVVAFFDFDIPRLDTTIEWPQFASNRIYQNDANDQNNIADILAGIEPAAGGVDDLKDDTPPSDFGYEFAIEDEELISEAVLVPQAKTVVSSSRDGKIKKVHFKNGDNFKKGDVILEYYCEGIKAELEAARVERKFARQKQLTTSRLFNMDLSSKLEVEQSHVEKHQAQAKSETIETRINDCVIRANYDGRVVKRMANDNEYTRTDRVLMEIAAKDTLDIEFLLPSKSLRWVNIDAPITITVSETGREYTGVIKQIYGEVDPVSQSIQIRAGLDEYEEPLLPGMSGQVSIDVRGVRQAGITGFLEIQTQ